jgi:ribA/ribD-fused uncharacterized protein
MAITKFEGRYRFLSNFYPCKINYQCIDYPSVEHFYVAMKVTDQQFINGKYYTPADFRELISKLKEPAFAKKLGEKVKLRSDWAEKKLEYMNWAIREKFKDQTLKELLLETGNHELVEVNYWKDTFWGVCNGKGQNHLGKILMTVRDEIRGIKNTGLEEFLK